MKQHNVKTGLALLAVLGFPAVASAQCFEAGGISYNVLSPTEHTVEVVPQLSCGFYSGNISIPATVTYGGTAYEVVALGEEAFYGATLSGITIPPSVTQIKYGCFLFANGLSSITIPASVTDIEALAFAANGLTSIQVDEDNPSYRTIGGMLFSKDTATLVACPMGKSGAVTLPQNTQHIARYAFAYCQTVTGVTLPEGLAGIGYAAFIYDKRLNHVVVPSSVSYIGENPFAGCSALDNLSIADGNNHYYQDGMMIYSAGGDTLKSCHKSADSLFLPPTVRVVSGFISNKDIKYVHLPEGVTAILDNAFGGSSLKGIDMPDHLDMIDEWAFYYCKSLTHVGMPSSLDTMGEGCFEGCSQLATIDIPNSLRIVPQEAFYFCERLSHITWGDAVAVIDSFAFGGCAFTDLRLPPTLRVIRCGGFNGYYDGTLRRVAFSAPVDTIEAETFYGQPLETVVLKNTQPPVATTYEGLYGPLDDADVDTVFIPCGSLDAYLADGYWGQFAGLYIEDCDCINDIPVSGIRVFAHGGRIVVEGADGETVRVYDTVGRTVENHGLPAGIYLVRIGDRTVRKVPVMR